MSSVIENNFHIDNESEVKYEGKNMYDIFIEHMCGYVNTHVHDLTHKN